MKQLSKRERDWQCFCAVYLPAKEKRQAHKAITNLAYYPVEGGKHVLSSYHPEGATGYQLDAGTNRSDGMDLSQVTPSSC